MTPPIEEILAFSQWKALSSIFPTPILGYFQPTFPSVCLVTMVMSTREIENKADIISISYMVYNAKKGSWFSRHGLFFISGRTDRPIWEGELGLQADSGPTIPIVLHFTWLFSSQSHEDEGRVMGACGTESAKERASPLQRLIYWSILHGRESWAGF